MEEKGYRKKERLFFLHFHFSSINIQEFGICQSSKRERKRMYYVTRDGYKGNWTEFSLTQAELQATAAMLPFCHKANKTEKQGKKKWKNERNCHLNFKGVSSAVHGLLPLVFTDWSVTVWLIDIDGNVIGCARQGLRMMLPAMPHFWDPWQNLHYIPHGRSLFWNTVDTFVCKSCHVIEFLHIKFTIKTGIHNFLPSNFPLSIHCCLLITIT